MNYSEFLATKRKIWAGCGIESVHLPESLFPWQAKITRWAARKGRAAVFADCGLGKTPMQLAWAQAIGGTCLILAPLCVAEQTIREGKKFGIEVKFAENQGDVSSGIHVTNYEKLNHFFPGKFDAVVLDESSILKSFDGKTRTKLIQSFQNTPYKLCCTATPAPNDIAELANHAEFLGLMTRAEFLATWFVHDENGWRMKGHAVKPFFRWLASWAMALRSPADIGFPSDGFILPKLDIVENIIPASRLAPGMLFPGMIGSGIRGRLASRRASLEDRISACVDLSRNSGQWIFWCGLNDESTALAAEIPDSRNVQGKDPQEKKESAILGFLRGDIRILVTKPKILGFGMNFQNCHNMGFVGLSDSYESYYQCIRRCWRYGQKNPVSAHIVVSDAEEEIVRNVREKERMASFVAENLIEQMGDFEKDELCA